MKARYIRKHQLAAVDRPSQPWTRTCNRCTPSLIGGTGPGGSYDGASTVRSQSAYEGASYFKEEVCHLQDMKYPWIFDDTETMVNICENTFYNDLAGGCAP